MLKGKLDFLKEEGEEGSVNIWFWGAFLILETLSVSVLLAFSSAFNIYKSKEREDTTRPIYQR